MEDLQSRIEVNLKAKNSMGSAKVLDVVHRNSAKHGSHRHDGDLIITGSSIHYLMRVKKEELARAYRPLPAHFGGLMFSACRKPPK